MKTLLGGFRKISGTIRVTFPLRIAIEKRKQYPRLDWAGQIVSIDLGRFQRMRRRDEFLTGLAYIYADLVIRDRRRGLRLIRRELGWKGVDCSLPKSVHGRLKKQSVCMMISEVEDTVSVRGGSQEWGWIEYFFIELHKSFMRSSNPKVKAKSTGRQAEGKREIA